MNVLDSVYDYVRQFLPNIPAESILQGYGNRTALPDDQRYVVIALNSTRRVGTNVGNDVQAADNVFATQSMREYSVDVDFFDSDQQRAQQEAGTLETLGRSYASVEFFEKFNLGFNYADDLRYLPYVDLTDQYIHRYRITLYLTYWETVSVAQEYADKVEITRVENIDAHHKP